jgi:SAM-dependent methyltransferase
MNTTGTDAAPNPEQILRLGFGFWSSRTLLSAVELGVFSALARAPCDLATLERQLGLHPRAARDFLDALVSLRLLQRAGGVYRNSPECELFLDRAKPSYVGGVLEMAAARLYPFWGSLTEALRTGQQQNEANGGTDLFATLYADTERLRSFLSAMSAISAGAAQAIATKFPWQDYRSFMDLGAAQGMVPVTLAHAHPHLHGIGFDLPAVAPVFDEFIARHGLSGRLRFHGGDFFADPLPQVDVIIMGHILHDWDLTKKRALLDQAYRALTPGGALLVYDAIIDDERCDNSFGLLMSLNMLIETEGGFDYTGADCRGWMQQAGFLRVRVEPLVGPDSMVVGFK